MWRKFLGQEDNEQLESSQLEEATESAGKDTPNTNQREKLIMAEQELKSMIHKRGLVKGKVTRIWTALQTQPGQELTISQQQLRVHARNIEKYYNEYNDVNDKIISLIPDNQVEAHEAKIIEFEDVYNNTLVLIETLQDAQVQQENQHIGAVPINQPQYVIHQQSLKAPLPTFNGTYENWPKFKSMFVDLMRNSPDSDAVKLFHLEKALVGEAEGILDAKTIQDNNYQQAWRILEERYENKRRIIDIHIEGILQMRKIAKKSSRDLRELLNECTRHIENLRFHGQDLTGVSELIVVHILSSCLDNETRELWEGTIEHGELPEYEETVEFLKKRCLVLERCEMNNPVMSNSKPAVSKVSTLGKGSVKVSAAASTSNEIVCELCGGAHLNFKCSVFRNMNVAQRYEKAKQANVCFNCLRKGHRSAACTSERSCSKCSARHHGMLHPEEQLSQSLPSKQEDKANVSIVQTTASDEPTISSPVESDIRNTASVTTSCYGGGALQPTKQVLLQTAIIDVVDQHGQLHPCRALLDSGSQAHILSESMARILGLPVTKCNITIVGANAVKTQSRKGMNVEFLSRYSNYRDRIECLVSERPTGTVPAATISVKELNIPREIKLADPRFFEPNEVDLILASNYVWDLLRSSTVKLSNGTTSLRETDLGWIVTGTFDPYNQVSQSMLLSNVTLQDPLERAIEKFWIVEEIVNSSPHTNEEAEVETHFLETYRRDATGRFVVQMPFKDTVSELDDNRELALIRFHQLEKRLLRNPELKRQYTAFIDEYEALGHCKEIDENKDVAGKGSYYLPHHAVLKPSSSSTKLRVVFNASSKSGKYSLNEVLKVGPTIQNDLFSILLRFRCYLYAFSGDVAKMYRQIDIDANQTTFLRIFWRANPTEALRVLELTTVTYGTSSAPYLATRCLVQLAEEEKERFPVASEMVKNDVYVDDLLSGGDTEEEAVDRQREVTELLAEGGFPIRKWSSNSPEVLKKCA
ncbi:uncharacterized protein LOC134289304 [Aedes albopictus]|uniref:CCHC-type domain-containing protein n=1 Tax=Aedes albopictus TaxID=7160 RepID=A0ABM2A3N7_AEDAL